MNSYKGKLSLIDNHWFTGEITILFNDKMYTQTGYDKNNGNTCNRNV